MAKNKEETSLVQNESGEMAPADFNQLFTRGFAEVRSFKAGDPSVNNNVGAYCGLLLGETEPATVEAPDSTKEEPKFNQIRVFTFHPVDTKTFVADEQVIHKVLCPAKLAAELTRMLNTAAKDEKSVIAGFMFDGKIPIQGGRRQMNQFRIFEKYQ